MQAQSREIMLCNIGGFHKKRLFTGLPGPYRLQPFGKGGLLALAVGQVIALACQGVRQALHVRQLFRVIVA